MSEVAPVEPITGRIYRWNAIADLDILLHIDSTGVRTTMPGRSSCTQWSAIGDISRTKTHLFLPVSHREAIILPRRAFPSDAAFGAVEALAKNGIATGRQEAPVADNRSPRGSSSS